MKHLTDLIEYLEANHHYAQVDEMTKLALDMTDVLKEDNQLGKGLYGNFHSDFSNEDKRKLKNQLGNLPNNVGVKQYKINPYDKIAFEIDNISENLVFIYVAPYISQNTEVEQKNENARQDVQEVNEAIAEAPVDDRDKEEKKEQDEKLYDISNFSL